MKRAIITQATIALDSLNISYAVHEFTSTARSQFGREAVAALGIDAAKVFKTIVFSSARSFFVAVSPVDHEISAKKLAATVGVRQVEVACMDQAQKLTGYVIGGISPLGQKKSLVTVIDDSAWNYDSIFISGGRRGVDLELGADDLMRATSAIRSFIVRETSSHG